MSVQDQLAQLKGQMQTINDQLAAAKQTVTDLQAHKQQLQSDAADLQGYLDWKKTQP